MERQSRRAIAITALAALSLFTSQTWASMAITATPTTLTITIYPNLPGAISSYSYTALVGPVRLRDKRTMNGAMQWAGMSCQGTVFACPLNNWTQIERAWATYFGSTITVARTDTDWQPGDQVCEGSAFASSKITPWYPGPESISIPGSCVALPNPNPVSCEFTAPLVAHGDVTVPRVNGNAVSASAFIRCSGNTTVNVWAIHSIADRTSTVPVRADSSITSHLTVNGVDGARGVSIPVIANQATTITLGSTLAAGTPTTGALLGSALVVIDIP